MIREWEKRRRVPQWNHSMTVALLLGVLPGILVGCGGGGGGGGGENTPVVVPVTLSGTVRSAAGMTTDSDVNDPNASNVSNDTVAQAQRITNPVMLGGYLNMPNTGPSGPSFSSGDVSDFFRISLAANQNITLNIADFSTGDLDLALYFDDGSIAPNNPDFSSTGTGQTETLIVPRDGDYVIRVYAFSGYTNYALVVGQEITPVGGGRLVSTDEFVPGEVIVRFRDVTLPLSTKHSPATRAVGLGLQARAGANGRAMLLGLGEWQNRQASFRALGITSDKEEGGVRPFRSADPVKQLKMDTLQVVKALRKRNDVLYAEPNYIRRAKKVPTDEYYSLQWQYPLISLPSAWEVSTGDAGVTVAVIDTGVLLNHPDLQGQFSADGGYDFIRDAATSGDAEPGIDNNPDDPGDSASDNTPSSFHGTHVAGIIAAATTFVDTGTGVAGVAPEVKIMPLRAIGVGGGTVYDVNQAVRYAAGLSNDSGTVPASKADVINLSLGGGAFSLAEQDVYTQTRNAGVIVVAAAGNESSGSPSYPAAYAGVISVSAVGISKELAPYSNFGTTIDVAAPGGDFTTDLNGDGYPDGILSTLGNDAGASADISYGYSFYQGTSMAAPHMAGVVALMKSVYSDLTPANVDGLLSSGQIVEDLGTIGRDDQFGNGLINARAAVDAATGLALGSITGTPFASASPAALNFGVSATSIMLSVVNGGTGTLNINLAADDAAWLTVVADTVDAATGLGSYRVMVDRAGLAAGLYTANISITSAANTLSVPVIQQVLGQGVSADTGYQYALLVDADTFAVAAEWSGTGQNGNYNFQFDNVTFANGQRYFLFAGTDLNNDLFICDAGEACGVYISRAQPKSIAATDRLTGLDFVSGFSVDLRGASTSPSGIPVGGIARRSTTRQVR